MPRRSPRLTVFLAVLGAAAVSARAPADTSASFSGTWRLNESLSEDPSAKLGSGLGGRSAKAQEDEGGGRGRGRGGSSGVSTGAPTAVMENEGMIVVVDEGQKVRITHGLKRQRVLFLDGEERELDDGDGPAKVTARRKGNRITVSVKWSSERKLSETWELLSDPRRVLVTAKVSGRESFTYKRVYEPAPDLPPEPTPTPTSAAIPGAPAAAPAAPPGPAPTPAGMATCSVRPPRGTRPEEYSRLARITQRDAQARAMAAVAPARPTSTITSDAEVYDGCLVWTFDFRFEGKNGVQEVVIDAGDGKVLKSTFEGPN